MDQKVYVFDNAVSLSLPEGFSSERKPVESKIVGSSTMDVQLLFERNNNDHTKVYGGISERIWDDSQLEQELARTCQAVRRSLPQVDNVDMATRACGSGLHMGILRYTSTSLEYNWFTCVLLLPVRGRQAVISMNCTYGSIAADARHFMQIADSIVVE